MRRRDFFQKSQQKRYASKSHHNPYFRGKGSRKRVIALVITGGTLIFIGAFVSFFLAHPIFNIREINIHGVESANQETLSAAARSFFAQPVTFVFDQQNRFLFDKAAFLNLLETEFTFRDIQLNRHGSRIDLRLVERTSQLLWQVDDAVFVVDLDGVVIRRIEQDEQEHLKTVLPLFLDRNDVEITIGDLVMTPQEIEAIFRFHEHLVSQQIAITQTEIDRQAGKWIGVRTSQEYYILFDATGDIDAQAQRLAVLLREKVKDPSQLQYIDLRFGDHVYFK